MTTNGIGIMHKFYKHKNSGKIYNVIGVGRLTNDPCKYVVVYRQMYDSVLSSKDNTIKSDMVKGNRKPVILPVGSIWVRDIFEFVEKMEPCEIKE